jgi:hypothetical protein
MTSERKLGFFFCSKGSSRCSYAQNAGCCLDEMTKFIVFVYNMIDTLSNREGDDEIGKQRYDGHRKSRHFEQY